MSPIEKQIKNWGPPPDVSVEVYDPAKSLSLARPQFRHVRDGVRVKLSPKAFNEVNTRFKSKLARLTLPRLKSIPRRPESPSLAEEWKHWQFITRAWERQVCFLPGDPEGWNVGMTTKLWTLDHVGTMIVFAVSDAGDDMKQLNQRAWHFQQGPIDGKYPISEKKSCPCLFFRVPRGAVEWDELQALSLSEDDSQNPIPPQLRGDTNWNIPGMPTFSKGTNKRPVTPLQHLLHLIAIRCNACQSPYAILSDGEISFFAGMKLTAKEGQLAAATFSGELVPEAAYPAIYLLLAAISELAPSLADRGPVRTLGALNCDTPDVCSSFHGFRDFDAYHMARDADYYAAFMSLKFPAASEAEETLPSEGAVLSLHRTEPIPRKLLPWRCYEGFAPVSLPREIAQSVCRTRRPRNPSLGREFLKYNTVPLSFQITARLTEGVEMLEDSEDPAMWYQVYVGHLEGVDGFLCLKVFDERLFPVKARDDDNFDSQTCPDVFRHADSLLRAEEAAYSRLKKYQGSLVPHFYGCVEVELPGDYLALGFLSEYVEGVPITRLLSAIRSSWTHEEQAKFYSRMRRALQVLKAHRISDTDSPEIRFLCVPRLDPDAADRADAVDLVVNNFAFTKQPWAPTHILPGSEDVQGLAKMLRLSDEMKAETGWLPEHRERYEF